MGEMGHWFINILKLDVEYDVVNMDGWQPDAAPGYGWPLYERNWVNPSPNASNLWMARCYAGTVMLEGTTLSEGRGTTRPLELFGAPDIDSRKLLTAMEQIAPRLRVTSRCLPQVGANAAEELYQDGIAIAAQMLDSAERRGKKVTAGNIAWYAGKQLATGRRSTPDSSCVILL